MQNSLYRIQFFSPPDDRLHSRYLRSNRWTCRFPGLMEIGWTHREVQTCGKQRTHGKQKRVPAPWPTPIYMLSMTSMVWNISFGQLGLDAWLCSLPALVHLLISWTWATETSAWFLSNN